MKNVAIFVAGFAIVGLLVYFSLDSDEMPSEPSLAKYSTEPKAEASSVEARAFSAEGEHRSTGPDITPARPAPVQTTGRSLYWKEALAQGFAVYIGKALRGGDPNQAMGAYRLLQTCESIDAETSALQERFQSTSSTSKDHRFLLEELTARQAEQRQCQSITSEMRENSRSLLERSARGGFVGAASAYARMFTPPLSLKQDDAWLVPLLINDAGNGDLSSIFDLACDTRRRFVEESRRKYYLAALKWAADNSPEQGRAQQWLHACSVGDDAVNVPVPEDLKANIVNAARRRLAGDE